MNVYTTSSSMIYWDCPTDTKAARAAERKFRKALMSLGAGNVGRLVRGTWCQVQCKSPEKAEAALRPVLPPDGHLRILGVTDRQLQLTKCAWGEVRRWPACDVTA